MDRKACSKSYDTKICIANYFPEDADNRTTLGPKLDYSEDHLLSWNESEH